MEDFSSLDFWLLFLLFSGSFSGAPASKATPSNENDSVKLLYKTELVHNKMKSLVLGPVYMEWGTRSSGVGFFCFHALGDTKQKKPTPLDRGPPLHVNRPLLPLQTRNILIGPRNYDVPL